MAVSRHPNGACSTLIAALTLCLLSVGTAQAELFWPHSRSWGWDDYGPVRSHHYRSWGWGDYEPFRQRRQRANKDYELGHKPKSLEVVKGPLQVIISIADQKISVYDDGTLLARSSVSTGVQGHPTPVCVFSVLGKELWHRSNIYSAAPMPYMQRITWSGIALHAGVLPGHPASHGCIRLAKDFAVRLWHLTKRGTRVIIAPNNVDPVQIASPRLFSKPKTASSSQEFSTDAPAGKDVATIPSTSAALRVQPRPHFPAGPEERNGLASDRNQSPRARISSGPACPDPYKKALVEAKLVVRQPSNKFKSATWHAIAETRRAHVRTVSEIMDGAHKVL